MLSSFLKRPSRLCALILASGDIRNNRISFIDKAPLSSFYPIFGCSPGMADDNSNSSPTPVSIRWDSTDSDGNGISSWGREVVPSLTHSAYKGQMGRIGILGGSRDYSGAPYYAGQASLRLGGDLAFVFCAEEASIPIKTYSPELMVTPFYSVENSRNDSENVERISESTDKITNFFPRLHALVIGPGLGRDPFAMRVVENVIREAVRSNMALVIDADGLWLLSQNLSIISGHKKCVLTPNIVEFERLRESAMKHIRAEGLASGDGAESATCDIDEVLADLTSTERFLQVRGLSRALGGVSVLCKGRADILSNGGEKVYLIEEEGSMRRCGGQGDILAGSLGLLSYWAEKTGSGLPDLAEVVSSGSTITAAVAETDLEDIAKHLTRSGSLAGRNILWAAVFSSIVTKRASRLAFAHHRRSMTSPDVISYIGRAFDSMMD